jgi:alanyl-tRNA synthetase
VSKLRQNFLDYFDHKGHHVHASTPLIPKDDPTLLFTAAGMVPFKPYFLRTKTGTDRATSCQKCFRTTDIDRVGQTLRHLTFFEMLGNFSFGDYFKEDAIHFAWDFLTNKVGLDPKRLHATVFNEDDEAEALWKKMPLKNPIARLGADTNFWAMGATGPCGPCSEIYYDLGPQVGSGPEDFLGGDGDRYLEIWNLVFMQSDRQEDGSLKDLPAKNIDTGMGLDRLSLVAEGKTSPFHTSLLDPLRQEAAQILGVAAPSADIGLGKKESEAAMAYAIISDHLRGSAMLITEGIIPSNVERGYVLRRLIRRAARYGRLLGAKDPFLHKLTPTVLDIFGETYPELGQARSQIEDTLKAEEERFLETLEKGEHELSRLLAKKPKTLAGAEAFKLYDTFGFPLELTRELCAGQGVAIDEEGFSEAQGKAVETARSGWKGSGQTSKAQYEKLIGDGLKSRFVGYEKDVVPTKILALLKDGNIVQELMPGDEGEALLLQSPFYPEGGGQVGDAGQFLDDVEDVQIAEVLDTQKPHPDLIMHRLRALKKLYPTRPLRASIDKEKRRTTAYHHTATHLLNQALQQVLGDGIRQAGSLVAPSRLRFDFTHGKPLSKSELQQIEKIVNQAISDGIPVHAQERAASDIAAFGATTLLGEDYGAQPRFLLIGAGGWEQPKERFSLELCGGTHVANTAEIQSFKIVKESSVASGIRRIEAVAGPALEDLKRREEEASREKLRDLIKDFVITTSKIQSVTGKPYTQLVNDMPDADSAPIAEIQAAITKMQEVDKKVHTELANHKRDKLMEQAKLGQVLLEVGEAKLSVQKFSQVEVQSLRKISDQTKRDLGSGVVFLGAVDNDKLSFVVAVTQDLVDKGVDASKIAKAISVIQKGRGGGRKDFAQGGGPDTDWETLVKTVKDFLS